MAAPTPAPGDAPGAPILAVLDIDRTDLSGDVPRVHAGRVVAVYALDHAAAYERAHEHGRNIGGLVVHLGTAVDFRPPAASGQDGGER